LEGKKVQLEPTYADKMGIFIPHWNVTRCMEIESKIPALVKLELEQHIPVSS